MSQVIEFEDAAGRFAPPQNFPEPEPAPTVAELEKLRNDVAAGLMYAHGRENANTSKVLEVASFSYALI